MRSDTRHIEFYLAMRRNVEMATWYKTNIISTIPLPYHCIPVNLDIQSTVFVSFHLNSIHCKRDLVMCQFC